MTELLTAGVYSVAEVASDSDHILDDTLKTVTLKDDNSVEIDMTLTAPNCPAADFMMEDVRMKVEGIEGIGAVNLNLVFEPEWSQDLMTEEAKLELGLL